MSYKALAVYPMPDDPQAFRDHCVNIHLPLVAKLPGLRSLPEAMATSLNSPEGQAVAADWLLT